jgi:hypothetical protein
MPRGIPKGKKKLTDEELKANHKKSMDKHKKSEGYQISLRKYATSEKGKATQKKYKESKIGKANIQANYLSEKGYAATRLKILQQYSKLHSNSNIPCCNCCGLNSHIQFLSIDHIQGKYKMDSIPELVKLGYSSKKSGVTLNRWIIKNNFPKGFQILCHSCNLAKLDHGKCPMENKPHF